MSFIAFVLGALIGAMAEHAFDLSGRALHACRRVLSWLSYRK